MVVKLPVDLPQLAPHRAMSRALGSSQAATHVWFVLFQQLLYRLQDGNPPGRLFKNDVPFLVESLPTVGDHNPQEIFELLVKPEAETSQSNSLLLREGEDFVCPRFHDLYRSTSLHRSNAQRAADQKHFNQRIKDLPNEVMELGLSLPREKFVDAAGAPLDGPTMQRIIWLIRLCDNALFRPTRPLFQYPESLVQNALLIVRRFTEDEINSIGRTISRNRENPMLIALTTDRLIEPDGEGVTVFSTIPLRLAV